MPSLGIEGLCMLTPITTMLTKFHRTITISVWQQNLSEVMKFLLLNVSHTVSSPYFFGEFSIWKNTTPDYSLEAATLNFTIYIWLHCWAYKCFASCLLELQVWFRAIEASVYMSAPTYLYCVHCNPFPPWCSYNAQIRFSFAASWTSTHYFFKRILRFGIEASI